MKYLKPSCRFAQTLFVLVCTSAVSLLSGSLHAQDSVSLEDERSEQLQDLGVSLPDPAAIRATAEAEFLRPVVDQNADQLEDIASDANAYSNLVSKITDQYDDYIRDNSRYDFVIEEVRKAPITASLRRLDREFKGIRNQAYLNLGVLAMNNGQMMEAFLFFNDAYRLSAFGCAEGLDNCIRHEAEQYMKDLLNVEGESYVYWKK